MSVGLAINCTTEVLTSPGDLDALEPEWSALFEQQPSAAPALHFDWVRAWWDEYGPAYSDPGLGLRVVAFRRDGRLVGVLPMYARSGGLASFGPPRLGFISTGEREDEETCPEYLDLLCQAGEGPACVEALADLLRGPGLNWSEVRLPDVSADSPLGLLGKALTPPARVEITPRGECPIADLAGGFEAYLKRLSSASRQQFRRLIKAATAAGLRLELAATAADVDPYFAQLVELHQARWGAAGKSGCFAAPRFTAFHRALARRWIPAGRAVLARLVEGGMPLALVYGFVVGTKFHFYQSGVWTGAAAPVRYPGFVAHLWLMERLVERGVETYDFLSGSASYKDRFATDGRQLVTIRVAKPGAWDFGTCVFASGWRRARGWLRSR